MEALNKLDTVEMKCHKDHVFHTECMKQWVIKERKHKCPLCREPVVKQLSIVPAVKKLPIVPAVFNITVIFLGVWSIKAMSSSKTAPAWLESLVTYFAAGLMLSATISLIVLATIGRRG